MFIWTKREHIEQYLIFGLWQSDCFLQLATPSVWNKIYGLYVFGLGISSYDWPSLPGIRAADGRTWGQEMPILKKVNRGSEGLIRVYKKYHETFLTLSHPLGHWWNIISACKKINSLFGDGKNWPPVFAGKKRTYDNPKQPLKLYNFISATSET